MLNSVGFGAGTCRLPLLLSLRLGLLPGAKALTSFILHLYNLQNQLWGLFKSRLMWRQSRLLDLRLWQDAFQAATPLLQNVPGVSLVRHGHSAGARKVAQLQRELARLKATSLEQLQEEARQQVCRAFCRNSCQPYSQNHCQTCSSTIINLLRPVCGMASSHHDICRQRWRLALRHHLRRTCTTWPWKLLDNTAPSTCH